MSSCSQVAHRRFEPAWATIFSTTCAFKTALGEPRAVFGVDLAQLSIAYGIAVEEQLVAIFPAEPE